MSLKSIGLRGNFFEIFFIWSNPAKGMISLLPVPPVCSFTPSVRSIYLYNTYLIALSRFRNGAQLFYVLFSLMCHQGNIWFIRKIQGKIREFQFWSSVATLFILLLWNKGKVQFDIIVFYKFFLYLTSIIMNLYSEVIAGRSGKIIYFLVMKSGKIVYFYKEKVRESQGIFFLGKCMNPVYVSIQHCFV